MIEKWMFSWAMQISSTCN